MIGKILKVSGYITIALGFGLLAYLAYLLFYTPTYFETNQPFRLEKTEYHIGETLIYTSEYCKYKNYVPVSITRNLANAYTYPLPNATENVKSLTNFSPGCKTVKVEVPLLVPQHVPTGYDHKYRIEIDIVYPINQFRTETRKFVTDWFILLPTLAK